MTTAAREIPLLLGAAEGSLGRQGAPDLPVHRRGAQRDPGWAAFARYDDDRAGHRPRGCRRSMSVYHSTLVATNLPFRRWGDFLPSGTQAVAIAGRLIDRATILRISGKPFRNPQDIHGAPLEDE